MSFRTLLFAVVVLPWVLLADEWTFTEIRRYAAPEATQGAAVDEHHVYAIASREIGKYRKDTGELVAHWEDEKGGRFQHINAGLVIGDRLYCAHSNHPRIPEEASVEVWDTATLKHVESIPIADPTGTLTWIVPHDGIWYGCFAHYRKRSDPALTRIAAFDKNWKEIATWSFPTKLLDHFGERSSSGGGFDAQGRFFISGHDEKELYLIETPEGGKELRWVATAPVSAPGQAFAWDRTPGQGGMVYGIERKTKEIIAAKVEHKTP